MLNALGLFEKDGRVLVSSVDVAENFEKRHKNVIQSIEKLKIDEGLRRLNFQLTSQTVAMPNGATREDKMYYMTRDGFTLLVMGFTGYKAMEWKVKYIKAFNAMEEKLKQSAVPPALPTDNDRFASYAAVFAPDSEYNKMPPKEQAMEAALMILRELPNVMMRESWEYIDGRSQFGRIARRMILYANWLADGGATIDYASLMEMEEAYRSGMSYQAIIAKYRREYPILPKADDKPFKILPNYDALVPTGRWKSIREEFDELKRKYEIEKKRAATAIGNLKTARTNEEKMRHQLNKALDVIAKLTK